MTTDNASRATISQVLAYGEFRALWLAHALSLAGDQIARVAIAVLVYGRTGSISLTALRAVVAAFARDALLFPARIRSGPRRGQVVWEPLKHWRVLSVLHNPCYAGAFCYGRRRTTRTPDGRIAFELLPREQWDTLIADHHPGYISIGQWEANLVQLAGNAQSRGQERKAGPPREGPALLQGLVLCGRCGRRMTVGYRHYRDQLWPEYRCMTEAIQNGTRICQRIPGAKLDQAVTDLLLAQLTPLAVETALAVTDQIAAREQQADRLRAAHVQRAEQRADLARRRYLAVDPGNRLVADTLEADAPRVFRCPENAGRVSEPAVAEQVAGVVDDGLDAQGAAVFEVLLEPGVLVEDVEGDQVAVLVDLCLETAAARWSRGSAYPAAPAKQQLNVLRSAQVHVVAQERLEEGAGVTVVIEDEGAGDFDLAHGQFPPEVGVAVGAGEGERGAGAWSSSVRTRQ